MPVWIVWGLLSVTQFVLSMYVLEVSKPSAYFVMFAAVMSLACSVFNATS